MAETAFDTGLDDILTKNSKSLTDQVIEHNDKSAQGDDKAKEAVEAEKAKADAEKAEAEKKAAEGSETEKTDEEKAAEAEKAQAKQADNSWWTGEKPAAAPAGSPKAAAENTDDNSYKELATLVKSHPELEYIIEGVKAGKSPFAIVSEVQGEDPQKMPIESLIKWKGKKVGLEDESIETEISNYEKLKEDSPLQAKIFENSLRTERADEQREALKKVAGDAQQTSKEAQQKQAATVDRLYAEIATASKEMIGKGFFGLEMTEDDAKDFTKYVKEDFQIFRADGSYDTNKLRLFWLAERKLKLIEQVNKADGQAVGTEAVLDDVSRINLNTGVKGKVPTPVPAKDPKDISTGAHDMVREAYTGIGK